MTEYDASVNLAAEFLVLQWAEDLPGEFLVKQWQEDLPAEFVVKQWQEDLSGEFIVRHTNICSLFSQLCVHNPRIGQNLNLWVEYDPQSELDHDCNDSWWQNVPNLRTDTALMKIVGSGGLGSDFFHTFTLNVFAVQASPNGQEERICAWAGHLAMVSQDFYGQNDFEIAALLVIATDTADQYQLKLIEKGGNEATMATIWPNYQDRYIVIYKEGTKLIATSYQDAGHTIPEDSAEITLSGDLNFQYVSMPMSYGGAIAAETSSGYIDPIFGSFEHSYGEFIVRQSASLSLPAGFDGQDVFNIPAEFVIRRSDLLNIPAEFLVLQGIGDIPAEFFVRNAGTVDRPAEFIIRHKTSEDLPAEFLIINAATLNLPGEFIIRRSTIADLLAEFFVKQAAVDLLGEFVVKQWAVDLLAEFDIGQDSEDLFGEFIIQQETSADLSTEFIIRHSTTLDLPAEFIIRYSATADLPAEFVIKQAAVDLLGEFDVGQDAVDLYAKFEVGQGSQDLFGEFIIRHETSVDLLGEFIIRHEASVDLLASFDGQTSVDLLGEFIVRHIGIPRNLLGEFIVRHTTGITNLLGEFEVRQFSSPTVDLIIAHDPSAFFNYFENVGTGFLSSARYSSDHAVKAAGQSSLKIEIDYETKEHDYIQFGWKYRNPMVGEDTWPGSGLAVELPAEFIIRRPASLSLSAEFEVGQGSEDLSAGFIIRYETSEDLSAEFVVKQWAEDLHAAFDGQNSINLLAKFIV